MDDEILNNESFLKAAEDYCKKQDYESLEQDDKIFEAFLAGINYLKNNLNHLI